MYNNFSKYYDVLMSDVDYSARTDYVLSLFKKYGKVPELLLDLACGTGGFSNEFAAREISVIGVDISEEMLAVAQQKSMAANRDILYVCQPAQELNLHSEVDGAVCLLDSLNHITDYSDFCEVFVKVSGFLKKGGLFIFDMNTEYKHKNILADNTFVIEEGDVFCVWQNFYDETEKSTDIVLDFFERKDNMYIRSSEDFLERAYSLSQITSAAENAGLKIEAVFGDMSELPLSDIEQRAVFVLKKI